MSKQLTAEQQRMIEENRRKALERRAQRLGQTNSTSVKTSAGSHFTSVQVQLPKQSPDPAASAQCRETAASAPKRFVPPFKKEPQSQSHHQPPATGCPFKQSTVCNPASSKQVRFELKYAVIYYWWRLYCNALSCVHLQTVTSSLPLKSQHLSSLVSSPVGSVPVEPVQAKHQLTSSSSGGAVSSFYKQTSRAAQNQVAQVSSNYTTANVVPAKKPAISIRGRCVPHTENRFRVEVSYHPGLIAVFKSIPSKNYGKCFETRTVLFCSWCRLIWPLFKAPFSLSLLRKKPCRHTYLTVRCWMFLNHRKKHHYILFCGLSEWVSQCIPSF